MNGDDTNEPENLIIAAMVVGLNLAIDLSYAFLDPMIRYR